MNNSLSFLLSVDGLFHHFLLNTSVDMVVGKLSLLSKTINTIIKSDQLYWKTILFQDFNANAKDNFDFEYKARYCAKEFGKLALFVIYSNDMIISFYEPVEKNKYEHIDTILHQQKINIMKNNKIAFAIKYFQSSIQDYYQHDENNNPSHYMSFLSSDVLVPNREDIVTYFINITRELFETIMNVYQVNSIIFRPNNGDIMFTMNVFNDKIICEQNYISINNELFGYELSVDLSKRKITDVDFADGIMNIQQEQNIAIMIIDQEIYEYYKNYDDCDHENIDSSLDYTDDCNPCENNDQCEEIYQPSAYIYSINECQLSQEMYNVYSLYDNALCGSEKFSYDEEENLNQLENTEIVEIEEDNYVDYQDNNYCTDFNKKNKYRKNYSYYFQ